MFWKTLIEWWNEKDGLNDISFELLQLAAMKGDK